MLALYVGEFPQQQIVTENERNIPPTTLQSAGDFEECVDGNGNTYYYNKITNESVCEKL